MITHCGLCQNARSTFPNIGECFADGARAFVGGSAIIGQSDVRLVIREFRNQVLRTRRKLLIEKANELGGTELVNKWIDLHVLGKKKDELIFFLFCLYKNVECQNKLHGRIFWKLYLNSCNLFHW